MAMIRNILLSATLWLTTMAAAQTVTTPMQAGRTADGIVYFMPKTAIHINLLVEK